jgi:hypothetical protein
MERWRPLKKAVPRDSSPDLGSTAAAADPAAADVVVVVTVVGPRVDRFNVGEGAVIDRVVVVMVVVVVKIGWAESLFSS